MERCPTHPTDGGSVHSDVIVRPQRRPVLCLIEGRPPDLVGAELILPACRAPWSRLAIKMTATKRSGSVECPQDQCPHPARIKPDSAKHKSRMLHKQRHKLKTCSRYRRTGGLSKSDLTALPAPSCQPCPLLLQSCSGSINRSWSQTLRGAYFTMRRLENSDFGCQSKLVWKGYVGLILFSFFNAEMSWLTAPSVSAMQAGLASGASSGDR